MMHVRSFTTAMKAIAVFLVITASVSFGDNPDDLLIVPKVSDSGLTGPLLTKLLDIGNRAGFEIGNGRKLIKNEPGKYSMKIYDKWEVGQADAFTEVISPLYEGVPRARLQINVVATDAIRTLQDLYESRRDPTWIPLVLGKLQGIQQEKVLSNGVHELEVRLFRRDGEVVVLQMDGRPGTQALTAFDKVISALPTFQIGQ